MTFKQLYKKALAEQGSEADLKARLYDVASEDELKDIPNDRYLSFMTRCIFNAGFHMRVVTAKWRGFEEAFEGFDPKLVAKFTMQQFEELCEDTRIIRNRQKIFTVRANARMINEISFDYGSFGEFLVQWPKDDQIGLMAYLKKHGSRLGGNSGSWVFRYAGKDSFVLTRDVVSALQNAGLDIKDIPNSKRESELIQKQFNSWHQESHFPYTHISQVAAFSVG